MSIIDGYELDDLRDKAARTERAEAAMENEAIVTRELKAEIERLRAENRFLFEIIKDDALLVERYNAFNERRLNEQSERDT